jgi:hypothetical protein
LKRHGDGATLAAQVVFRRDVESPRTLLRLAETYADEPRVTIQIVDNTRGRGQSRPANLAWLKEQAARYTDAHALQATLDADLAAGRITPDAARLAGTPAARGGGEHGGRDREPERGGGSGVPPSAPLSRPDAGPDDSPDILAALNRRDTDARQARSILDDITARPAEGASERPRDVLAAIEPKAPEGPPVLDQHQRRRRPARLRGAGRRPVHMGRHRAPKSPVRRPDGNDAALGASTASDRHGH